MRKRRGHHLQGEWRPNGGSRGEGNRDRPYVEIENDRPVGAKERTGDGGTGSEVDVTEDNTIFYMFEKYTVMMIYQCGGCEGSRIEYNKNKRFTPSSQLPQLIHFISINPLLFSFLQPFQSCRASLI